MELKVLEEEIKELELLIDELEQERLALPKPPPLKATNLEGSMCDVLREHQIYNSDCSAIRVRKARVNLNLDSRKKYIALQRERKELLETISEQGKEVFGIVDHLLRYHNRPHWEPIEDVIGRSIGRDNGV